MKAVFSLASKISPSVIFVDEVSLISSIVFDDMIMVQQASMKLVWLTLENLPCPLFCRLTACWVDVRTLGNMKPCVR